MAAYVVNTQEQQAKMLSDAGFSSFDEIYADIPEALRLKKGLDLPDAMSEIELAPHMKSIAAKNANADDYTCFLGAGVYDHYIPSVVNHIISRQEFYTAYTPYQPEISQGTLQAIFEYQSMICTLTGMDTANASMYDGATALTEAACLGCVVKKRGEILVSSAVNPQYRETLATYAHFKDFTVTEFSGIDELCEKLSDKTASVVMQTPNFFGVIEDVEKAAVQAHKNGALLVVSCNPVSLALLKSPGEMGADIAVGEGQPLGNPMNFGGPYFGFFAVKKPLLRKMPGRIVGMTADHDGNRGYVLTLQTREQHIRREKATSNICSNAALNALAGTVYLATLGQDGLYDVAYQCFQKAHYACDALLKTGLFTKVSDAPFFNEFALKYKGNVKKLNEKLLSQGVIGGYDVGENYSDMQNVWLVAVTEKRTKAEIDALVEQVKGA